MKKEYSVPEAKVVKFNVRDIVITSGPDVQSDVTIEDAGDDIHE